MFNKNILFMSLITTLITGSIFVSSSITTLAREKEPYFNNVPPIVEEFYTGSRKFTLKEIEKVSKILEKAYKNNDITPENYEILTEKVNSEKEKAILQERNDVLDLNYINAQSGSAQDSANTTTKMKEIMELK